MITNANASVPQQIETFSGNQAKDGDKEWMINLPANLPQGGPNCICLSPSTLLMINVSLASLVAVLNMSMAQVYLTNVYNAWYISQWCWRAAGASTLPIGISATMLCSYGKYKFNSTAACCLMVAGLVTSILVLVVEIFAIHEVLAFGLTPTTTRGQEERWIEEADANKRKALGMIAPLCACVVFLCVQLGINVLFLKKHLDDRLRSPTIHMGDAKNEA